MCSSMFGLVPVWDELVDEIGSVSTFFWSEAEQVWQSLTVWKSSFLVSEFVEIWVLEGFHWGWSLFRVVD